MTMSYTIIKSVSIVHDKADNLFRLRITGCDNNLYPHRPHTITTSGGYESKDTAMLDILDAYLTGEFQCGSNDYAKFVKYFECGLVGEALKKRLDALSSLDHECWKRYIDGKDYNKWRKINARINKWRRDLRKSNAMLEAFKEFKTLQFSGKFRISVNRHYIISVRTSKDGGIWAKTSPSWNSAKIFRKLDAEYLKRKLPNYQLELEAA